VYAGDVFNGKLPRRTKRSNRWLAILVALVVVVTLGIRFLRWPSMRRVAARAVAAKKLPGEAGAMLVLRQHLVSEQTLNECLALMSKGLHGGAYHVRAVDRCRHAQLGEWKIDAKTHAISR
jgi:Flp pilus assembly protein TadB